MKIKDYDSDKWERTTVSNKESKIKNKKYKESHNPWANHKNINN